MAFCRHCGKTIPDDSTFCPACGKSTAADNVPVSTQSGSMAQNVAGMLSYFTFIPAVIFLLVRPYSKNVFVRFHALQSVFFNPAYILGIVAICMMAVFSGDVFGLRLFPALTKFFAVILGAFCLLCFTLWIVCLVKAFSNEEIKLPVIGELAEQQSRKV